MCYNLPEGRRGGMDEMNMQGTYRIIIGLRAAGWDEKQINDFLLFIETGEEQYKPKAIGTQNTQ